MAVFASDVFVGTAAANLTSVAADTGQSWIKNAVNNSDIVFNTAGTAVVATAAATIQTYYLNVTPPSVDQDIAFTVNLYTAARSTLGVFGHGTTDSNQDGYFAQYFGGAGWTVYKRVGGSVTDLGAAADTTPRVVNGVFKLRAGTQQLFIDGVSVISTTDSDAGLTAAGRVGIVSYYSDASTNDYLSSVSFSDGVAAVGGSVIVNSFGF